MISLETILAACHVCLLTPLAILSLHKAWTVSLFLRNRQNEKQKPQPQPLPPVTVQLPIYNERYVAERLVLAVAELDYPRHLLEVQVLDDSTDDTSDIVRRSLGKLPKDLRIQHIRRQDRSGYKAGALKNGLRLAKGEFLAIFDADFLPPRDFLSQVIPEFTNAKVGMVQARWAHLNRKSNLLTQIQAVLLDGHFCVEQVARANSGCLFNFNGTAGIFRRQCIEDAGGWQFDTLTEDMDLSYRAQLAGWEFRYLPQIACPAELPVDMNAFLTQQHRWAKGSVQTGRKLSRQIWQATIPRHAKLESVFHLFGNLAFPLLLALILIAMPLQWVRYWQGVNTPAFFSFLEGLPILLATASVLFYYGLSQQALGRLRWQTCLKLPLILSLGAGISINNTVAVLSAWRRKTGEFRRTPKQNVGPERSHIGPIQYHSPRGILPLLELGLGLWSSTTVYLSLCLDKPMWLTAAFHGMFALGLFWIGGRSLGNNLRYLGSKSAAATYRPAQS